LQFVIPLPFSTKVALDSTLFKVVKRSLTFVESA
jgi:hypothetical protein